MLFLCLSRTFSQTPHLSCRLSDFLGDLSTADSFFTTGAVHDAAKLAGGGADILQKQQDALRLPFSFE